MRQRRDEIAPEAIKAIIDTDPGTDDALALMMAFDTPKLDILGLTTVFGNASLAHTTRNALRLLEYLGRSDIPVYRGAARPLKGRYEYSYGFHGPAGLTVRLPLPKTRPQPLRAPDYIIDMARTHGGEITLIALGPLTNVARVLTREPRFKDWVKELVVMGGAVEVAGNKTPHAEANIYADPLAAEIVFSSGIPTILVGLDVCNPVYVSRGDIPWPPGRTRTEMLAKRILTNWFARDGNRDRYWLCDPVALVAILNPELIDFRRATVTVEASETQRMGRTSAVYGRGNVRVASDIRSSEAKERIKDLLHKPGL